MTQSQDSFSCLPVELILLIFQHLTNRADVVSVLNVCRSWRRILLSPEIWPSLANNVDPGLAAHIRDCSPLPERRQPEAFHSALRQAHLRSAGCFRDVTHHPLRLNLDADADADDSESSFFTLSKQVPIEHGGVHSLDSVVNLDYYLDVDDHVSRVRLYSHGRVAWWPESWHLPYFAIVDDLRARTRRMYVVPGLNRRGQQRLQGWKTALGEQLFVIGQEDVGVCVWHLERNEMRQIKLSIAFERCVVQGETLLFVGRRFADVWVWSWDTDSLSIVDAAGQGCYRPGPVTMAPQVSIDSPPALPPREGLRFLYNYTRLDFILHLTRQDIVFVVTYTDDPRPELVVYELTSGKLTSRIVPPEDHMASRILRELGGSGPRPLMLLRHERCDAHGGYNLMTVWMGFSAVCAGLTACGPFCSFGSVCFNVYTKQFTAFVHHTTSACKLSRQLHLWNGQLTLIHDTRTDPPTSPRKMGQIIIVLDPCDGHLDHNLILRVTDPLPVRTRQRHSTTGLAVARSVIYRMIDAELLSHVWFFYRVAYALAEPRDPGTEIEDSADEWLAGDDQSFIHAMRKGYTVWRFDENDAPGTELDKKSKRGWRMRWMNALRTSTRRDAKR